MRSLFFCFIILFSCLSHPLFAQEEQPAPPKESCDYLVLEKQEFSRKTERDGVFVPACFDEIQIWPEEFRGELLVLEVIPHGAFVNKGDRIATLNMKDIDERILQSERQVRSAKLNLLNKRERAAMAESSAHLALEHSEIDLDSARKALAGWEKHELEFSKRNAELSQQATDNYIADQEDELAQLEAMYRDDELVDATEEIVIKRSRRDLARTRSLSSLQKDRRVYHVEFNESEQTRQRHRALQAKEVALEQLRKTQEIDRRSREDSITQAAEALDKAMETHARLKSDRALFELRAGRSGLLLHGSEKDYFPGSVPPRYKRGSRLPMHSTLFLIAEPDRVNLAIDIPESDIQKYKTGAAVHVEAVCSSTIKSIGTLDVARYPQAKSAAAPENKYRAVIEFDKSLSCVVPGMRGKAHLESESLSDAFVVPKNAVHDGSGESYCWVASPDSNEFKRVKVEKGASSDTEIVVSGELSVGWKVLLGASK